MQRSYNGLLATDLVIGLLTSTKSDCIRFKSADKNSDGKIDSKELTSYLSLKLAGEKIHTEYSRVELPGDPAFDWFKEECARRGGSISGPFDEFVAPKILVQEKTGPKEVFLDAFTQGLADQIDAGVNTRALDKAIEDLKDGELAQIWEEIRGLSQEPGVYASELLQELRNEMLALEQKIADLKAQKFQKLQPARGALQEILDLALRRGDASLLSPISLDRIEEILRYYSRKVKNPPFAVLDQSEGKQFYMCTYTTARELFPFENGEEAEVCPVMKGFAIHAPWCK
jgi:hypothetical protein